MTASHREPTVNAEELHCPACDMHGPCPGIRSNQLQVIERDRLARAILVAAMEEDRRPTSDGFEWYGSADEMADAIIRALDSTTGDPE